MRKRYLIVGVVMLTLLGGGRYLLARDRPHTLPIPGQPSGDKLWELLAREHADLVAQEQGVETGEDDPGPELTESRLGSAEEQMLEQMLEFQGEMVSFVNRGEFTRANVRARFSDNDLPILLAYLMDRRHRDAWEYLILIVSQMGNPDLTVPVLIDFVIREDSYENHEETHLTAKAKALLLLGELGGEEAEEVLRLAITEQGARDLARNWLDGTLPSPYNSRRDFLIMMQANAAVGLVLTGDETNAALVEARHAELLAEMPPIYSKLDENVALSKNEENGYYLFSLLAEALIARDLIEEMGGEAFEPLLADPFKRWGTTTDEAREKYGVRFFRPVDTER